MAAVSPLADSQQVLITEDQIVDVLCGGDIRTVALMLHISSLLFNLFYTLGIKIIL